MAQHPANVGRIVEQAAPNAGIGLFAAKHLKVTNDTADGNVAFVDKPLFTLQHTGNRRFCLNCANCGAFTGGVSAQLFDTIFNEHHFEHVMDKCAAFVPQWEEAARNYFGQQNDGDSAVLSTFALSNPSVQTCSSSYQKVTAPIVYSAGGERYCSEACKQEHWESGGHKYLCCASVPGGEDAPLYKFKVHAIDLCDTLLLAGQVYASLVVRGQTHATNSGQGGNKNLENEAI